jgi:hypothetical protein
VQAGTTIYQQTEIDEWFIEIDGNVKAEMTIYQQRK